jgi:hypothetical protein
MSSVRSLMSGMWEHYSISCHAPRIFFDIAGRSRHPMPRKEGHVPDLTTQCLIAYFLIYLTAGAWYLFRLHLKLIEPTPAMWCMFATGTAMYLGSLILASRWDRYSGTIGTIDAVYCVSMFCILLRKTGGAITLLPFEKYYFGAAVTVVCIWAALLSYIGMERSSFVTNILVQALISSGYFATVSKILRKKENTEPFASWILAIFGSAVSLYPAYRSGKVLALGSSLRALIMLGGLLLLMLYYRKKRPA